MAYTPYVVIAALAAAAAAALLRRWVPAALAGLAAVLLAMVVLPRVIPDGDPSMVAPVKLRVMTSNLKRSRADLGAVMDLVRSEKVDLLSMEELTPEAAAELRRRGLGRLLPFGVLAGREGVYGSGLFARFPLRSGGLVPGTFNQPRATMRLPGGPTIHVVCVHTSSPTGSSTVKEWNETLGEMPPAQPEGELQVLAGDFNATLDHDALRDLIDTGYRDAADAEGQGLVPTWPVGGRLLPPVTIDHILADRRIGIGNYEVHDVRGSDHRALVATLSLPRPGSSSVG